MNDNHTKSTCNRRSLSSMNSARRLQTECHSRIHAGAVTHHQRRASRTQAGHSQTVSHLLTTVTSRDHALNTCIHKNFKIRGTQHRLEYYPSSSHKESVHLGSLTGRVQILTKGGTEVHRFLGFLGFLGL